MRWKSEIWSQSQYGFIWLNVLPLIHNYIYTGHKFVQSPWRDMVIEKNKYCIPARNFAFSRKIIAFPWENVHLQNIFILSQKYCVPLRNFIFSCKIFALSCKTTEFPRYFAYSCKTCIILQKYCIPRATLHSLEKNIAFPRENFLPQNIFIFSQKYWALPRMIAFAHKIFSLSCKSIAFPEQLCILSKNDCVPLRKLSLAKHLHSLAKVLRSPKNVRIHL